MPLTGFFRFEHFRADAKQGLDLEGGKGGKGGKLAKYVATRAGSKQGLDLEGGKGGKGGNCFFYNRVRIHFSTLL